MTKRAIEVETRTTTIGLADLLLTRLAGRDRSGQLRMQALVIVLWAVTGPLFHFSETYIYPVTTRDDLSRAG
jgi:hypothetical protein